MRWPCVLAEARLRDLTDEAEQMRGWGRAAGRSCVDRGPPTQKGLVEEVCL